MLQRKWLLFALPAVILMAFVAAIPFPVSGDTQTHYITVDSHQFEFTPNRIDVRKGDRVVIEFTASDVVHGFFLDGYDIDERVEPGITRRIEFTADQVGKFRYRCSVSCGSLHPFMIGEMIVGPNLMLWRAIGILVVGIAAMLSYLWFMSGERDNESQITFA